MDILKLYTFDLVTFLSILTVIGQCIALSIIICLLIERSTQHVSPLVLWASRHGLLLMFIVTVVAMLGSLFMSEIAGWTPCKDCWLQRICLYPEVLLLGMALWKNDRHIARYILALSIIGICFSTYHYWIQMQNIVASPTNPATPCDASGVSCVKTPFLIFGYITIPLMAWTAFFLTIVGSLSMLLSRNHLKAAKTYFRRK